MRLGDYIFYKVYRFSEMVSDPKIWSDLKAIFVLVVMEILLVFSIINYYKIFIDPFTSLMHHKLTFLIIGCVLGIPNYYHFFHNKNYKVIIKEYDSWPANKNKKGSIFVSILLAIIIANFFVSFAISTKIK
jgi:hypothetical protein